VLVGAEPTFPYERPPLSKSFLRGESRLEEAFVHPPAFYEEREIDLRTGTTATGVDPHARTVRVAGGDPIGYDALLIATGAAPRRPRVPGVSLEGVHALRSAADAAALRAEVAPGRRAVLVGMGFIGSEVAASLRARGVEVHVVDGNPALLARVLGPEVGGVLEAIHRDHGVAMTFRDRLERIEGDGRAERVVTTGGLELECDLVLLGLGVEPVTGFLAGSGIGVEGGVLVDERCRAEAPGVFAAGDVASHLHPLFGRVRVEHWQNARAQGRAAALSMLGRGGPYAEVHWFWSEQFEHEIQYAGWHVGWDELVIRGSLEQRRFAAFYLAGGRVRAVAAMDRGDDVRATMPLIAAGGEVDPVRLRDEDVDLAGLAPARSG
jgi:3-phenylpropionate/trans-cinnamate dioxygenase ferredoxin reductase subunit